jgi:hypothetical protein
MIPWPLGNPVSTCNQDCLAATEEMRRQREYARKAHNLQLSGGPKTRENATLAGISVSGSWHKYALRDQACPSHQSVHVYEHAHHEGR